MKVTIYSDGGADPNPGYGGWGAVLIYGKHSKQIKGNAKNTTNNRMELSAAIGALKALKRPCEIEFYTDSQYLRRGITEWIGEWVAADFKKKGKAIPNSDLWRKLNKLIEPHTIDWHWVKGHSGNHYNEIVDRLATEARLQITPQHTITPQIPTLYTRGSFRGKTGTGGWAFILIRPSGETTKEASSELNTTNNRMEIMAVIEGLSAIRQGTKTLQIVTVSDYVFQGATNWIVNWKKRNWEKKDGSAVSNADLWQRLEELSRTIDIQWFNGKNTKVEGDELEEAAKLAGEASRGVL
ncbi:MAG: ribonuclease HI [Chloroflexota bacterium]